MDIRIIVQAIVMINTIGCLEATVTCTVYDMNGNTRDNIFECDSPVILSCKVPANTPFIQWFIAETVDFNTPLAARCFGSSCSEYITFDGRYAYTYNPSDGISNITIRNVMSNDSVLKYRCDDGTTPPPFVPTIKGFPRNTTTNITYSTVNDYENVRVTTECITLSEKITFIWRKTKNTNGTELENFTKDDVTREESTESDNTSCVYSNSCGKESFSNTLKFKPGNTGDQYYLHCTIVVSDKYGPPNITMISSRAYLFKDTDECLSGPCSNGGTCTDKVNGYECSCSLGYEGTNCEIDTSTTPINNNSSTSSIDDISSTKPVYNNSSTTPINNISSTSPITNISSTTPVNNNSTRTPVYINPSTSLINNSSSTTVTPNLTDKNIKVLIYVGATVGGIIVVVILIYIVSLACRQRKGHSKNLVT